MTTLGILKIGANINFSSFANRTAANFDIVSICRVLASNFDLHFITHQTRNTVLPKEGKFTEIMDAMNAINDLGLDALVVFNGNVNGYGGYCPHETIAIWKCINHFKGRVFYIHTDGFMRFNQVWPGFEKRGWDKDWKQDDLVVTRDDIVYITQARDPYKVQWLLERGSGAVPIKKENIIHFPVEEAILLRAPPRLPKRKIEWDLIYGGSFRSGRRHDRMLKYFFGQANLKTLMFGSIAAEQFTTNLLPPVFEQGVPNSMFVQKLSTSIATVYLTDAWYAGHWTTLRLYESLIAGTIPFIDIIADPKHRIFLDSSLEDFIYVSTRKELSDRIRLVKSEDCLNEVIQLLRADVSSRFDREQYKADLAFIINNKLENA